MESSLIEVQEAVTGILHIMLAVACMIPIVVVVGAGWRHILMQMWKERKIR